MIVTDILFKAKCKDKDMWVEGFYFNMPDKTRHYEESWRKDIIPVGSYIASPSPDGLEIHEVDPITVCIWTGIEDWKGKKIWEHDILMCDGNPGESIDALIAELQDVKAMMNGSYPFEKERIREHELDFDTFLHT